MQSNGRMAGGNAALSAVAARQQSLFRCARPDRRGADPSFEDLANPAETVDEALLGLFGDGRDHAAIESF